jgi:hypothetical protein
MRLLLISNSMTEGMGYLEHATAAIPQAPREVMR